jgi:hypothetical protein
LHPGKSGITFIASLEVFFLRSLFSILRNSFSQTTKQKEMKRFFALLGFAIFVFLTHNSVTAQPTNTASVVSKNTVSKPEITPNVVLQSFDLAKSGNTIKLNWQTSKEKNNNYFEIQRSIDGIQFDVIALMFAKEDAENGAVYRYNDQELAKLNADKVYYRLRIIDITGKYILLDPKKLVLVETIVPQ